MRRDVQGILLILVGGAVLRITLGGTYLNFVKEGMRTWLLISGSTLIVLGVMALLDALRRGRKSEDESTPHDEPGEAEGTGDHGHGPRAAWLLILPVLAIFLIAPPALGAFAVARDTSNAAEPAEAKAPPLPAGDPVPMSVAEYVGRAVWDDGLTLEGRTVAMTGFVTPDPAGGWWLSRLAMACCAADAIASKIKVVDAPDLPANTWVDVTGAWIPGGGTKTETAVPLIEIRELVEVPQPKNPYD